MVHLPRFLYDQLSAYLAERPHSPDDLVFTAPQGDPLREQKFAEVRRRVVQAATVKAGPPAAEESSISVDRR